MNLKSSDLSFIKETILVGSFVDEAKGGYQRFG